MDRRHDRGYCPIPIESTAAHSIIIAILSHSIVSSRV
jgi:hypothetical protein